MSVVEEVTDLQSFEVTLQEKAQELLLLLETGEFSGAMHILAELSEARNTIMYQEVGRLTRGLHTAIKQFNIDVEQTAALQVTKHDDQDALSEVSNAHERLNFVLELTESAANKTMDMVDASMPVAAELGVQAKMLRKDWQAMADAQGSMSELKDLGRTTESFLLEIEKGAEQLQTNYTEILLAQGFQDITGQLIKRVNGLVHDVESSLVNLVVVAGKVDSIAGVNRDLDDEPVEAAAKKKEDSNIKGHGPQVLEEEQIDVVSGQDDVDDLLSSLGF
ncbi:MAG: protein phosphatase CheZ [Motiliproteus sp.]